LVKIFEAVKKAKEILKNVDTPQLDAEVLLSYTLGKDRTYLHLNRNEALSEEDEDRFFDAVERRKNGEPVQYIVGVQEFMGLDFFVKPGVLIPRGDTEILVEEVLKRVEDIESPVIVDVGCGSGAISVSIAYYKKDSIVYSLDIMDVPLEITRINAENNGVIDRVNIIKSDILKSLHENLRGKIDIIVSNPPYIKDEVIPTLMREVRDFEPYCALSGGKDGLYFYREITRQSLQYLKKGGLIAYEIGHDQKNEVCSILENNGFYDIICIKDLAGHDRVVLGRRG
jgi:release factor glutamine methyltransferase